MLCDHGYMPLHYPRKVKVKVKIKEKEKKILVSKHTITYGSFNIPPNFILLLLQELF